VRQLALRKRVNREKKDTHLFGLETTTLLLLLLLDLKALTFERK
jgi:hypothetical protein